MKTFKMMCLAASVMLLGACGTLTGIPSHGGGKRFAVEQELVAASSRAAVKNMDLSALQGRKVALYVTIMGDQGSGSISGGRYSLDALIRGEYLNNPTTVSDYDFPQYVGITHKPNDPQSDSTYTSTLNVAKQQRYQDSGAKGHQSIGLETKGMGDFHNDYSAGNPKDSAFLTNLVQTVCFLRGINVVPPEAADTDVFINVDVFGTIRSRTELHVYNAETLRAQTKLEYFAVDKHDKHLVIQPTVSAYEAKYQEKYAFWAGPYQVKKNIGQSDGLMVDFSDIKPYASHHAAMKY